MLEPPVKAVLNVLLAGCWFVLCAGCFEFSLAEGKTDWQYFAYLGATLSPLIILIWLNVPALKPSRMPVQQPAGAASVMRVIGGNGPGFVRVCTGTEGIGIMEDWPCDYLPEDLRTPDAMFLLEGWGADGRPKVRRFDSCIQVRQP
jgi:hypothetical protein